MPDLPTRADLFNIGADEVLSRSAARSPARRLSAEQVYTPGSDINILVASESGMAEEIMRQLALSTKALFLDGAEREDLDRLVADRFSPTVVRKGAAPAIVTLEITRVAGAFPAITLPTGTRVRSTNGQEFATTAPASLALAYGGPVSVVASAVRAGSAGNVQAGTITSFVDTPDPNLLVTNPFFASGGDETETDARLRSRARDFFRTARRGTKEAIEFGALTVAGVRQAQAIETVDSMGIPTGHVQVYIADAQGQANSALTAAVVDRLIEYRAAGVYVSVLGSIPTYISIALRLRYQAGTDSAQAFAAVVLSVVAAVNALQPSQTLAVSSIIAAAKSIRGVIVLDDAVVTPLGDIVPASGQILRTRTDLVTAVL